MSESTSTWAGRIRGSLRGAITGFGLSLLELSMRRYRWVLALAAVITVALAVQIVRIDVDTDPENMLPSDNEVRVRNEELRERFGTTNVLMVGVLAGNEGLTPGLMTAAAGLVDGTRELDGVIGEGIVSLEMASEGPIAPETPDDAEALAAVIQGNALLSGSVIAPGDAGIAMYVPLESKDKAEEVADEIHGLIDDDPVLAGEETAFAGLPLAEDAFGKAMFIQMGLLAPIAGALVFLLMLALFRRVLLVAGAMLVAMLTVTWTVGLLVGTGFTVHIMASMIPIFLMPIAILDSVHILSEFFDRYPSHRDRKETLRTVFREIMVPITYTSATTAIAFASLALAPIPPAQVFGVFVAAGVLIAWLLTIVFVPAFVMLLNEGTMEKLASTGESRGDRVLAAGLRKLGRGVGSWPRTVTVGVAVVVVAAVPGLLMIEVNDNPVRWFKNGHEVRQDMTTLTDTFAGTYNASLLLETEDEGSLTAPETAAAVRGLQEHLVELPLVGRSVSYVDAATTAAMASGSAADVLPATEDEFGQLLTEASTAPTAPIVGSLVTADRSAANVQFQLKSGDNRDMQRVLDAADEYLDEQPLPEGVSSEWAGETYLNLVWQDKMVSGMLAAFLSTLVVVLVLMAMLFGSLRWALLGIAPVAGTIVIAYGVTGYIGKDYDMPMAVLSTLVLGIGIDFAIHFIERIRELLEEEPTTEAALARFFEEPARALTRNALVIALGFVPLLFSSLVPYLIVGVLLASIMSLSWLATILLLPAVVRWVIPDARVAEKAAT